MDTMAKQELGPHQTAWLEALESGKYKQGTGGLRSKNDEYCCLGVGCEIAKIPGEQRHFAKDWEYDGGVTAVAPSALIGYLGLRNSVGSPRPGIDPRPSCLTELNDDGKSFSDIAALIRSDPAVYFRDAR